MAELTADNVSILARNFLALGQCIGHYRKEIMASLSPEEFKALGEKQLTILDYADQLYATSAILRMNEIEASLQQLQTITSEIEKDITKLKSVQRIINIAEKIVVLGASVMSTNPQAVAGALGGLASAWKAREEK